MSVAGRSAGAHCNSSWAAATHAAAGICVATTTDAVVAHELGRISYV
jgi:hypothetical protein